MKKIFLLIGLLLLISFLNAELLRIDSYVNQTKIGTSDRLNYTIEISGEEANKVAEPNLPDIKGFRNLGSSTSTSSSVSITNGRMQSEYTKKYKYTLVPKAKGKYIIPPVTIRYKNETYKTTTITVEVVEGSTEPPPPTSGNFNRNQQNQTQNNFEDNLFLIAEIDKTNYWKNEPITVNYTLFTRYNITNISFGEDQNFSGFWKEDVFTPSQINFSRRNYNGVLYNTMLMKTIALFPTQSGKMAIPSMELLVDIRTEPTSFFDFGSTKQYSIKSKPIRINVRELPEEDRPQNFTNAVGTYRLNSNISDTNLKVGDSFTYTLEVKGEGNLKQFDVPTLPPIQHLRFLDPEITNDINQNQKSGTKTIKYLVISQEKGTFTIPPLKFTFFDTQKGTYRTLQSDSYTLNIAEGSGSIIPSSTAQSVVRMEGKDIGFIVKNTNLKNKKIWFDSFLYWFIMFLFFLLVPASSVYAKQKEKLEGNIDYQRQRRAYKILKKYMEQATEYHKNEDIKFYAAAQIGLSSYLCDKLRILRGSTTDQIITEISQRKIENELLEKIKAIFETCNKARFMPGGFSKQNIKEDFLQLQEIITEISRSKL